MGEGFLRSMAERFAESIGPWDPARLIPILASAIVVRWADMQEADREAIAAFDGTSFVPALVAGTRWRDFCDARGRALSHILAEQVAPSIEDTRDVASGALVRRAALVFLDIADLDIPVRDLLIDFVQQLPLTTPSDRAQALDTFDSVLRPTIEKKAGHFGALVTPPLVVDLVTEIAAPKPGERIYDPCFGFAAMLTACARRVREHLNESPKTWGEAQRGAFLGVELRPHAFVIGLARMILAGVDQPALDLGNSLERPLPKDRAVDGFDCIVSDPPFGGRLLVDAARQFPVKATSSEALFLQHIMASLRPGGRAVVVLPEGAFFRGGADAELRRLLLEEYRVEHVVSLPPGAYLPYSGAKTGVLVLRREPPGTHVRFVDAETRTRTHLKPERGEPLFDVRALAATVRGELGAYATREVAVEDLRRHDAILLPPRPDSPFVTFLRTIRETDASVPVRALEAVADVFVGFRHVARELVVKPDPSLLGYLRVSEVGDGETKPLARFLTKEAAADVPPEKRLRSADIVVTRSGSVGRVAVIANGAMGCVPAQGLAVVRPKTKLISPHYLAAILQSAPVRVWMTDQAQGVTIRHVSLAQLRRLEVPVPDLALQDRVLRALRRSGGDASVLLLRALTSTVEDPIADWLESSECVQRLLALREGRVKLPAILEAVQVLAEDVVEIRAHVSPDEGSSAPELSSWFSIVARGLEAIRGTYHDVPKGAVQVAALALAQRSMERATRMSFGRSSALPVMAVATDLSRTLAGFLELLTDASASDFKLVTSLEPPIIEAGTASAVTLRVRNQGSVPVYDVAIRTRDVVLGVPPPDFKFEAKASFLDAGGEIASTAAILAPSSREAIDFYVGWEARQIDGKAVHDVFHLALEVSAESEPAMPIALGPSPYIVGSPIERGEMLYGRDDILRNIKRQLSTDHRANVILLEGNRRTGKTSILKHLEAPGELPGWIPVNTSLQGAEGSEGRAGLTSKEIFRLLTSNLAVALSRAGAPVWLPDQPPPDPKRRYEIQLRRALTAYFEGDHPFEAFEIYLKTVIDAVAPKRILLMLDEFDKIQEGIDAGITSPQIPENLRYLFHTHPELGGILSGSRRLTRLRNEYWSALFGIGYAVRVEPLAVEDARDLVTRPAAGRLVYAPDARDRIVELCARQPFLIQTLCNRIFEGADERGERTVTPDAVERAATAMTGDNEHFETLWGYAGTDRRRLILAQLCQLTRGAEGRALDVGVLEDELTSLGVASVDGLGEDMAHLRELELVDLETYDGYQRYRLTIPLLAEWIRRNKDFADLARRAARVEVVDDPYG